MVYLARGNLALSVAMKLYEPMDGEKAFEGLLLSYTPEKLELELTIKTRKKKVEIPMDKVAGYQGAVRHRGEPRR